MKQMMLALASLSVLSIFVAWTFLDAPYFGANKIPSLHGKTESAVFEKLGSPDLVYDFSMDEAVGEFRVELFNTYPLGAPENSTVLIRECTWHFLRNDLTVWFHRPKGKWVALNTCRYDRSTQF